MSSKTGILLSLCLSLITSIAVADTVTLIAGGGTGPDGGPADKASLGQPFGVGIDSQGNIYIADYSDHRIRKVDTRGIITTYTGTGKKGYAGDGGPATQAEFNAMHDLVIGANDDVYVADSDNLRVRRIDAKTGIITTIAGTGKKELAGDGGPGNQASLDGIACLYFDPTRTKLYLAGFSRAVRVLDLQTGIIDTIKGLPGGRSVAVDTKGNIYVGGGSTLRMRRPDGKVEVLLDKKTAAPGELTIGDNTKHLALDADGNLLLSDDFGHAVKKYLVAEKKLVPFFGSGKRGTQGIGGPAAEVELNGPHGVYFHAPTKTVYVSDSRNKRVLKVETLPAKRAPNQSSQAAPQTETPAKPETQALAKVTPTSSETRALQWSMSPPLLRLAKANNDEPATLLDPCVVKHDGKWHLFAGGPGGVMYYQLADFNAEGPIVRGRKLSFTGGGGVPQVYYHRASNKWHLVGQMSYKDEEGKMRFAPCISTNDAVDNPDGWSMLTKMQVATPLDENNKPAGWMDFYVIFDGDLVHLFGTSGGRLWRTETKAADFPQGWSSPVLALRGSIVYANHVYRQETTQGTRFLTTITSSAQDPETKKNKQFQVSYVAENLTGPWTPEFTKWDNPYAGFGNTTITDSRWSREIIHGEPLRSGNDERMLIEREPAQFIFHAKAKLQAAEGSATLDCVGVLDRCPK